MLGPVTLIQDVSEIELPKSQKTKALLAYLAVQDRPVRRERLCELLWNLPDDPRGALRWSLSKLRKALSSDGRQRLMSDRDQILLEQSEIKIDYVRLTKIADPCQLPTETLTDLAMDCRGAMLADIHLDATEEFSAWHIGMAAEAEVRMVAILSELIERLKETPAEALGWARKLQDIAPFNETAAVLIRDLAQQARQQIPRDPPHQPTFHLNPVRAPEQQGRPERGIVSVCVIDLASPDLEDAMDIEDEADAIGPLTDLLSTTISDLGGEIVQRQPTGFSAVFGHRADRQEHTLLACQAARQAQQAVAKAGVPGLAVRAGIDTGEVLIRCAVPGTPDISEVSGVPVRTAAQLLQALGGPGILLSNRAAETVEGYMTLAPSEAGGQMITGETGGLSRWQMRRSRPLTPFVGRDLELRLLRRAASGIGPGGRIVGISGAPGVGKSRLVYEFVASDAFADWRIVECGALEIDCSISLNVAQRMLLSICNATANAPEKTRAAALDLKLFNLAELAAHRPALRSLLHLPPDSETWARTTPAERTERITTAMLALMAAEARAQPTILLIDDLQWMDEVSALICHRLLQTSSTLPILVLVTYRPEYDPVWAQSGHAEILTLQPLDRHETGEILRSLIPDGRTDAQAFFHITDGNPFFIEETARVLTARPAGTPETHLPPSVQSILAMNIRRLNPDDRALLQAAAVLGRRVDRTLLSEISGLQTATVDQACNHLCEAGLLVETAFYPVRVFNLKHALLQNSAYALLTRKDRVGLHRRIFRLLESGDNAPLPQELAHHAALGDLPDKATHYRINAAALAMEHAAPRLAREHLNAGLEALQRLPEGLVRDRLELGLRKIESVAEMMMRGWSADAVAQVLDRAAELTDRIDDAAERFVVLRGKAQYLMLSGRNDQAHDITCQCQSLLENRKIDNTEFQIETAHMFWTNGFFRGDYDTLLREADKGRSLYDPGAHSSMAARYSGHDPGACACLFSAIAYAIRFDTKAQGQCQAELDSHVERLDHHLTRGLAHWSRAYCALFSGDSAAGIRESTGVLELGQRHKLPFLIPLGTIAEGWALLQSGACSDGIRRLEEGVAGSRTLGATMGLGHALTVLAEGHLHNGGEKRALALLDEAQELAVTSGGFFQFPEILRVRAEHARRTGADTAEVAALLRDSMARARSTSESLSELRAATALVELGVADEILCCELVQLAERAGTHPDALRARALI
ncbi:AAA family ATPase [Sedimentitalea sp.]|uniref:AAA family ATPase n=1 Tax=Sedimentitalea sp. TaxID=2048915 RepID=UPI0032979A28